MGLDGVEIVLEVEDHFGIHLSDDECTSAHTVADLVATVMSHLDETTQNVNDATVLAAIRTIIAVQMGIPESEVRPESAFIRDLRIDG